MLECFLDNKKGSKDVNNNMISSFDQHYAANRHLPDNGKLPPAWLESWMTDTKNVAMRISGEWVQKYSFPIQFRDSILDEFYKNAHKRMPIVLALAPVGLPSMVQCIRAVRYELFRLVGERARDSDQPELYQASLHDLLGTVIHYKHGVPKRGFEPQDPTPDLFMEAGSRVLHELMTETNTPLYFLEQLERLLLGKLANMIAKTKPYLETTRDRQRKRASNEVRWQTYCFLKTLHAGNYDDVPKYTGLEMAIQLMAIQLLDPVVTHGRYHTDLVPREPYLRGIGLPGTGFEIPRMSTGFSPGIIPSLDFLGVMSCDFRQTPRIESPATHEEFPPVPTFYKFKNILSEDKSKHVHCQIWEDVVLRPAPAVEDIKRRTIDYLKSLAADLQKTNPRHEDISSILQKARQRKKSIRSGLRPPYAEHLKESFRRDFELLRSMVPRTSPRGFVHMNGDFDGDRIPMPWNSRDPSLRGVPPQLMFLNPIHPKPDVPAATKQGVSEMIIQGPKHMHPPMAMYRGGDTLRLDIVLPGIDQNDIKVDYHPCDHEHKHDRIVIAVGKPADTDKKFEPLGQNRIHRFMDFKIKVWVDDDEDTRLSEIGMTDIKTEDILWSTMKNGILSIFIKLRPNAEAVAIPIEKG